MIDVVDEAGSPTMAAFTFRDRQGRVYPNPARRLAPDFFFHNQIYRAQGESVTLPPGDYSVTVTRGPKYREQSYELTVGSHVTQQTLAVRLKGCWHYESR
ncbi:MAG: hypothetical protein IIC50_23715 [Planctomycetes bacterium]|nr:hypothetical protein [Planctomycetota bacterium]